MSKEYQFPQPKYKAGQHIQTSWRTDDTREMVVEQGVIIALTYTDYSSDRHHYDPGFTYHVQFYNSRVFADAVPENDIELIGESPMTQPNQISITIPESVPTPKFSLFEEACYGKHKGIITGMAYENPLESLRHNSAPGWRYDLSYSFQKTPMEAVNTSEDDTLIYEDSLSRCAC
ncbi:hypothetical protein H6F86_20600 [Phormidium sp. FACHB-592]|uniref:Uncharacterized protein n=1 Tax=Stenomitos frigidus AS-A4 TaxID=2933935 RepID=A0ABV0KEG4_9CYAN|nr:hypothetical protein [Phormidium sp. FACHB-592]MBD2076233.1 hypothetical protein [Phormidium sp. FACHB-592]